MLFSCFDVLLNYYTVFKGPSVDSQSPLAWFPLRCIPIGGLVLFYLVGLLSFCLFLLFFFIFLISFGLLNILVCNLSEETDIVEMRSWCRKISESFMLLFDIFPIFILYSI